MHVFKTRCGASLIAATLILPCITASYAAEGPEDKPLNASGRLVAGGSSPSSLPADIGTLDITEKMGDLLSTAKETGEVMRLWAAYKAGQKDAVPEIFTLARNGNARAQNLAGYMLDNGEGVKQDSAAAATYFQRAAREYPLAKYNLGVLTYYGRGARKDEAKAMALFKDSATSANVAQACVQLAVYYLKNKNENEAYKWANEGSNRGNVKSFYLLGRILYQRGRYQEALGWIQKAANASEPNAPALMSLMNREGHGIGQNNVMAAAWWLIYSALNRSQAGSNLVVSSSFGLNDEEQRRALNFANNWIATHGADKRISYQKTLLQTD
ncbi:tetratricopeptide repeat protein [Ralstonia pseudosolanacearum]|uniref:tetratricopeptide repeat protein n=1 Tax=Ralstonia pseudosolanacearum TaxID=1310165 RepID=UPI003CE9D5BE